MLDYLMENMIKQFVWQHFYESIIINCQCKTCRKAQGDSWGVGTDKLIQANWRQPCGGVDIRQKINSLTNVYSSRLNKRYELLLEIVHRLTCRSGLIYQKVTSFHDGKNYRYDVWKYS